MAVQGETLEDRIARIEKQNREIKLRHKIIELDKAIAAKNNALISLKVTNDINDMMPAEKEAFIENPPVQIEKKPSKIESENAKLKEKDLSLHLSDDELEDFISDGIFENSLKNNIENKQRELVFDEIEPLITDNSESNLDQIANTVQNIKLHEYSASSFDIESLSVGPRRYEVVFPPPPPPLEPALLPEEPYYTEIMPDSLQGDSIPFPPNSVQTKKSVDFPVSLNYVMESSKPASLPEASYRSRRVQGDLQESSLFFPPDSGELEITAASSVSFGYEDKEHPALFKRPETKPVLKSCGTQTEIDVNEQVQNVSSSSRGRYEGPRKQTNMKKSSVMQRMEAARNDSSKKFSRNMSGFDSAVVSVSFSGNPKD